MQPLFDIDENALKSEVDVARNYCTSKNENFGLEELRECVHKEVFPNLYILLQIALTLPISSATCERSFSAMKRIRNWLRTTMLQDRFSSLSLLAIEKDVCNMIDVHDIVKLFLQSKDRRLV